MKTKYSIHRKKRSLAYENDVNCRRKKKHLYMKEKQHQHSPTGKTVRMHDNTTHQPTYETYIHIHMKKKIKHIHNKQYLICICEKRQRIYGGTLTPSAPSPMNEGVGNSTDGETTIVIVLSKRMEVDIKYIMIHTHYINTPLLFSCSLHLS